VKAEEGTFVGTAVVLAVYVVLATALTGLGLGLRRLFTRATDEDTWADTFLAFWVGFGLVLTFLMLWHFVLPVNGVALGIVLTAGLASFAAHRPSLLRPSAGVLAVAAAYALWLSHLSTGEMKAFDTALYHMQGVKWSREFPIVPGLVNLFGPMGFNNVTFLYDAMLDVGPFRGRAWHVCNGLFVLMMGLQIISTSAPLFSRGLHTARVGMFALLLAPLVVNYAMDGRIVSFATLEPAALLVLSVTLLLYRMMVEPSRSAGTRAYHVFAVMALSAVAVAAKTSMAVFTAGVVVVVALMVREFERPLRARTMRWAAVAVLVVASAFVTRGIILSGYVLFPTAFAGAPVEWRAQLEHVQAEYAYIVHGAHQTAWDEKAVYADARGEFDWTRRFLRRLISDLYDVVAPIGLLAVGGGVWLWCRLVKRRRAAPSVGGQTSWLLGPLAAAVVGWFATAPIPYYATPFLQGLAAWVGAEALGLTALRPTAVRAVAGAVAIAGLSPAVVSPAWDAISNYMPGRAVRFIVDWNVKVPPPGELFMPPRPASALTTFTTTSGIVLNVPTGERYARCWDAPLPCTNTPAPNLRLRDPQRLDRGFVLDGGWQMQGWPDPWTPHLLPALRAAREPRTAP
jgi:hypothetical protein